MRKRLFLSAESFPHVCLSRACLGKSLCFFVCNSKNKLVCRSLPEQQRGPAAGPSLLWLLGMGAEPEPEAEAEEVEEDEEVDASCVVMSLPLGVLKSGAVEFCPPLPSAKQEAIERLGVGLLNKCFVWCGNVPFVHVPFATLCYKKRMYLPRQALDHHRNV